MKTIFVDTNYFLRIILDDIKSQQELVTTLFQRAARGEVVLISSVVVFFELFWVLANHYQQSKSQVIALLDMILDMSFIEFENKSRLISALQMYEDQTIELEDCYNLVCARENNCVEIASFDKKLQRVSSSFF